MSVNDKSIIDENEVAKLGFDPSRLQRVEERIKEDIAKGKCHGASIIAARHGKIALDVTEGFSNLSEQKKLEPNSVFATMSVAKQFTNVLALSLVERGLLYLHAPVCELIPEFATLGKEKVNLYHLLTHTSGIMSAIPPVSPEVLTNIEELVNFACQLPLENQPGERVNYSILLGHSIIAALCLKADGRGRSYSQMLHEDLFRPLGMKDTSLGAREDLMSRLCPVKVSYKDIPALLPPEAVEGLGDILTIPNGELPGGGCISTVTDVHRFAEMLRRGGELEGNRILSPAMIQFCTQNHTGKQRNILFDMWTGTRNWDFYPANLGVGFFTRGTGNLPGLFSVMNSERTFGGFGAGSTGFTVDPEKDLTFTFLSTGLMEDSYHFERIGMLAGLVVSAIVD